MQSYIWLFSLNFLFAVCYPGCCPCWPPSSASHTGQLDLLSPPAGNSALNIADTTLKQHYCLLLTLNIKIKCLITVIKQNNMSWLFNLRNLFAINKAVFSSQSSREPKEQPKNYQNLRVMSYSTFLPSTKVPVLHLRLVPPLKPQP